MGADRGIHVEVDAKDMDTLQPVHVSKILAELAKKQVMIILQHLGGFYLSFVVGTVLLYSRLTFDIFG